MFMKNKVIFGNFKQIKQDGRALQLKNFKSSAFKKILAFTQQCLRNRRAIMTKSDLNKLIQKLLLRDKY